MIFIISNKEQQQLATPTTPLSVLDEIRHTEINLQALDKPKNKRKCNK